MYLLQRYVREKGFHPVYHYQLDKLTGELVFRHLSVATPF